MGGVAHRGRMEPSHSNKCHCSQDVEVSVLDKGANAKHGFILQIV